MDPYGSQYIESLDPDPNPHLERGSRTMCLSFTHYFEKVAFNLKLYFMAFFLSLFTKRTRTNKQFYMVIFYIIIRDDFT